jgi:hypothetical protein
VADTCELLGKDCGPWVDGCGGMLDCGTCAANESCGGGGTPGVCGGCVPTTCAAEDVHCGVIDDGCGTALDCGAYEANPGCNFGQNSTAECPDATYALCWGCAGGKKGASPPPPGATSCIDDPAVSGWTDYGDYYWCCDFP